MGINIDENTLYSMQFADHHLIFAVDDDALYMLKKLNGEYTKWGLNVYFKKTKYMVVGGAGRNLTMVDGSIVKCYRNYKYLGKVKSNRGGSDQV